MYEIVAQSIGFVGAFFLMISFQMKNQRKFFACQTLGSGLFLINYLMLSAFTGVLISIMSVTRSALAPFLSGRKRYFLIPIITVIPIIAGFFIYQGIETVLMIVAYCIFTLAMFTKNSKLIRITQLFIASPLQLAHNIIVFSLGGILCESFNIISIIVSFFRIGFKNFEKGETPKVNKKNKEVLVVFKTHLDIGFCDMGETVVKNYLEHFIPNAIKRGYELKDTDTPFIWTTGSWLVNEALKRDSDGSVAKAIEDGIIKWHALPFTPFCESMSKTLFNYGLSVSKSLDERFGTKTLAAKTSDVPGHTVAIVPHLAKAGVELLHIGTNGVYLPPEELPEIFRWKNGGSEITVIYQRHYGNTLEIGDTVITWGFTGDNLGPQSAEQIKSIYENLRRQYPDATVTAATLDEVAVALRKYTDDLPVYECEIGDLWIQNVGTDPKKVGIYRDMLRYIDENGINADLTDNLLVIPEHTWGGDPKVFYPEYCRYTVAEMQTSENDPYRRRLESSWQEKRDYLTKAEEALGVKFPYDTNLPSLSHYTEIPVSEVNFEVLWQLFDRDDYRRFFDKVVAKDYGSDWWSMLDNYKYGMPNYKGGIFKAEIKKSYRLGILKVHYLEFDTETAKYHGLPCIYAIECGNEIEFLTLGQKPNRLPNAFWVKFKGLKEENWQISKLGQWIDAKGVVGSPLLHATDYGVRNGEYEIECLDSMLVAPYGARMLDNEKNPQKQDMYFNLYNNVWGCNQPMWYSDDSRFRFKIHKI